MINASLRTHRHGVFYEARKINIIYGDGTRFISIDANNWRITKMKAPPGLRDWVVDASKRRGTTNRTFEEAERRFPGRSPIRP